MPIYCCQSISASSRGKKSCGPTCGALSMPATALPEAATQSPALFGTLSATWPVSSGRVSRNELSMPCVCGHASLQAFGQHQASRTPLRLLSAQTQKARLKMWSIGRAVIHALLNQVSERCGRLWRQQQAALADGDGNHDLRAVHATPGALAGVHLPTEHAKRVRICRLCPSALQPKTCASRRSCQAHSLAQNIACESCASQHTTETQPQR